MRLHGVDAFRDLWQNGFDGLRDRLIFVIDDASDLDRRQLVEPRRSRFSRSVAMPRMSVARFENDLLRLLGSGLQLLVSNGFEDRVMDDRPYSLDLLRRPVWPRAIG